MRDQIQESQQSMISQLTQLLAKGIEKGKSTVINSGDDNEDLTYPQALPRPQQYQAGTSAPVNYPTGSGSNPICNPTNPIVPDLDDMAEMDRIRVEFPKQLEDRCK
ncbi:putative DNA double-strand break repair Rad50 ATPase [Gossypium australe]|uniref:Putative DNA double-strand break repair Rad50 ATPase n=1 Tax=Gossypium australe TaxID=47621 RepID=A0A5B6VD57_9ROSI|nr:putative DNA double-strand break repair Rad50 ATPase [Gossypium australe]